MPVLKVKKNGQWVEVWGATNSGSNTSSCWSDESKRLLITILRAIAPEDQVANIDALETALFGENTSDATITAILGSGVLGKIILGRSA